MAFTSDPEIEHTTRSMIDCTLPKEAWTHEAHFAGALWLVTADFKAAQRDMPGMIRAYNESVEGVNSDTEGYHETITRPPCERRGTCSTAPHRARRCIKCCVT